MRSSEQIKAKIKHLAKTKDLKPQEVFQMYFFERVLERLEKSSYRHSFIIKGGLLISSLIGIDNPMKMDITTGDAITPREMIYEYPLMFDEGHLEVMAYPLETILAEKIETIIRRNIATTRMRDFYDVYLLYKLYEDKINFKILEQAIENTSKKRESLVDLADYKEILVVITSDDYLKQRWQNYLQDNPYVGEIELEATLDVLTEIFQKISK